MHTIRLRGPWRVEPVERFVRGRDGQLERTIEGLPSAVRATMPADWSNDFGDGFLGRVRYARVFQKPTGLETGDRVWLVIGAPRSHGAVTLNDEPLGEVRLNDPPPRFDITDRLADHNRLEIVVTHPALDAAGCPSDDSSALLPGGLIGLVRLEIEE